MSKRTLAPLKPALLAASAALMFACGDDDPGAEPEDAGSDATVSPASDAGADSARGNIDGSTGTIDASSSVPDAAVSLADAAMVALPSQFALRFAYTAGDKVLGCAGTLTGQGLDANNTVDINDLRFFVHDLRFLDKAGKDVALTLDSNDFQLHHEAGTVSLVDLTSNDVGGCTADAFPNSEGTKRVHEAITGTTLVDQVASVRFTVGVPQALMKKAILETSAEGQPSPLGDLQWPWAVGWRHFVLNFALKNADGVPGVGFVHLGSRDCAPSFTDLALVDRDRCTYVNNPNVALDDFSLTKDMITVDIPTILKKLDFVGDLYDEMGNVTGQGPAVGCHSFPDIPDCPMVFEAFGMSLETGTADASKDAVFGAKKQ